MKFKYHLITTALLTVLAGCGEESTVNVKEPPPKASTGVFVDSPVSGLSYRSESVAQGTTNDSGEYSYFRGDQITFYIGDLEFPPVPASSILTPLDLFKADTPFNTSVVNTLRLLQALDTDGDASNGISISADAAAAAQMVLAEGETAADFFNRPANDFAAEVETWLTAAGSPTGKLADFDQAVAHFVNFLASEYGTLFPNTFDVTQFNGTIYNPALAGKEAVVESINFAPADETGVSGSFTRSQGEVTVEGSYEFLFGRRVLALTVGEETSYIISRSYNTVNQVYSLCESDSSAGLASIVAACDADEDAKTNLLTFTEAQTEEETQKLLEKANEQAFALKEEFDTDIDTFFNSSYKRLTDDPNSGAMYLKTGGSPAIDPTLGQLTLAGARFSIGNAADDPARETTSNDSYSTGVFNISQGFTISFDVIDHNSSGSFNMYVDNNTTGQGNSVHGDASKFYGMSISNETMPIGQRFSYTYIPGQDVVTGEDLTSPDARGVLNTDITNSFFQLRTDSSASIIIDNLTIETVAEAVDPGDVFIPPEPIEFTASVDFTQARDDTLFTAAFLAVSGSAGEADDIAMLTKTGGSVTLVDGGIQLDGGRFTLGNYLPGTETRASDDGATGVLDLSKPYQIVLDVISVSDEEGDNTFEVYVDNNTTSSANSMHGGDSRIYKENILNITPGELIIPGSVGTDKSFLQFRTSSNGVVVFNNVRIEYIVEQAPTKVALPYTIDFTSTTSEQLFTAEFEAVDGNTGVTGVDTPMYKKTGGSVEVTALGVTLDSGRFTLGNTTPDTDTSGDDTSTSGVFDLTRPYKIKLDITYLEDTEGVGVNKFQVYVDNNTSSSSKSIHGGYSRILSEYISDLSLGELVIDGFIASSTSFIQFRTESGGIVEFNNLTIEYDDPNVFFEESFTNTGADFYSADYRALPSDATIAMYAKTGGTVEVTETGSLVIDSARFSIGNTTPETDSSGDDTATTGAFDFSKPYKIVMDIIRAEEPDAGDQGNNFQIYMDNNTSSSSKSIHGGDSKFYQIAIADLALGELEVVVEAGDDFIGTATSFIQLRTESGGVVEIDNLRFEYLNTNEVLSENFDTTIEELFSPAYSANSSDESVAMYNITGGSSGLTITDGQLTIDSARFSIGNSTPDVDTSGDDVTTSGALDLSKPYKIVMDIVYLEDTEGNNNFQIYVDNNTSSSSKSIHGGDSKFYQVAIVDMTLGTLEVEGMVATETSFLQLRTESGGIVGIDNFRIEYIEEESSEGGDSSGDLVETSADAGFAGYSFDITGGAGGTSVTVDNGADLIAALEQAADSSTPITIYVDGIITDANSGGSGQSIEIKDMDNVSIIGVADRGELDGIGIHIRRANNIIVQNLKIHHVLTGGKDAISIEGDDDGSTTSNIWIDHNELYSSLSVDKDYYDGLIDSKSDAKNITISYNYLHDHWKASLHGSSDSDGDVSTERNITFHHNWFENIESRLPLFRFGKGHLYNNYFNNINSTAINSRMGAELLVENNAFENTQNPIVSFYSEATGYWNASGNIFGDGVTWTTPDTGDASYNVEGAATSSYVVPYPYNLDAASEVKTKVMANAGVGVIDQSGVTIPPLAEQEESAVQSMSLPYTEDFSATDSDDFFSASYAAISGVASAPMNNKTGGTVLVDSGQLTLDSSRFTIGDAMPSQATSSGDSQANGALDLSKPYKLIITIASVADSEGNNNFQVYVDNNTTSSGNSIHGSSSKFYAEQITSLSAGELEITGFVATANSFLQLRTESGGTVVIDNLRIEYTE
ncbi:pectate lyase family protein [Colwellia sp. MEBiC06753]